MRRSRLVGAGLLAALATTATTASTASTAVPTSTATYRAVTVDATVATSVRSLSYGVVAGQITSVTPTFRNDLRGRTVTARYGSGPSVPCGSLLHTILTLLPLTTTTRVTCVGLLEPADRPGELVLTIR